MQQNEAGFLNKLTKQIKNASWLATLAYKITYNWKYANK